MVEHRALRGGVGAVSTAELLAVLLDGDPAEVTAVLHEAVVFEKADGAVFRGRAEVLAMFSRSEGGATYRVLARDEDALVVEMSVPGVPGELRFLLEGECLNGVLLVVRVAVG